MWAPYVCTNSGHPRPRESPRRKKYGVREKFENRFDANQKRLENYGRANGGLVRFRSGSEFALEGGGPDKRRRRLKIKRDKKKILKRRNLL